MMLNPINAKERLFSRSVLLAGPTDAAQAAREIRAFLARPSPADLRRFLERFHPADIALAMQYLNPREQQALFQLLTVEKAAEVLEASDPDTEARLLRSSEPRRASAILEALPADERVDALQTLEPEEVDLALEQLDLEDAQETRRLLQYDPETAGGLMTLDYLAVPEHATAQEALEQLRAEGKIEAPHYVYVVDDEGVLKGVLELHRLVTASPDTPVMRLTAPGLVVVFADQDREEVAEIAARYDLLALPVVDREYHLLGVVTAKDILDTVAEELVEDMFKISGSDAEALEQRSPTQIARMRLPWLLMTMVIELFAGAVVHHYDEVLARYILLASFMPIISAISGNVGLQAAAIVVRGLATGHISLSLWWRPLLREILTVITMGLICGTTLGIIGIFWSQKWTFGLVIGMAMSSAMLTAGIMGTLIPMISKRLGFDPATTAGPFETAFQDVIGFAVFLSLAARLTHWLG